MAHFYGQIHGARGEATRTGSRDSGLWGHLRGWNVGARVSLHCRAIMDEVSIHATTGSNGYGRTEHIGTVTNGDDGLALEPSAWTIAQVKRHLAAERKRAKLAAAGESHSVKVEG